MQLLPDHKDAAEWIESDDFVFARRIREKPRQRNSVRTRILYGAIEKAKRGFGLRRGGQGTRPKCT